MDDYLDMLEMSDLNEKERSLAGITGMEIYRELVREFGGAEPLYIPKPDGLTKPIRNRCIRQEFNGSNAGELARKYTLSEATIRFLVKNTPDKGL